MVEDGGNRAPPPSSNTNTISCDVGVGVHCTIDGCSSGSFFHGLPFDDNDITAAAAAATRSNVGWCSHIHRCNNPHNDRHTHTCLHVHTTTASFGKGPPTTTCGNREAVREKEEAAASLEWENRLLREHNRLLLRRVHTVEAENARLKCLLVDLLARIDTVLDHQKQQQQQEQGMLNWQHKVLEGWEKDIW